ncbi:MAG TPA: hypothetical protein EYP17_11195 [Candidatus Latescibacteria bacterium]|nr:hypothetical protein [Candidatus Latescibacterota bacterium]
MKVMVIGLDAPIAPRLYRYAREGHLPAIARLIENGVYAEHCLVPFPTITPPNWTTIVTGASLGTHGITCFNVHNPGDPLDLTHQGFDTTDCRAEYIWQAAERAGRRSIILNYPSTWPPTIREGVQIGGAGLSINEWRYREPSPFRCTLAAEQLFATDEYPLATTIEFRSAQGWRNMPPCRRALESELSLMYRMARYEVEPRTWHLLALDEGDGFGRVLLCEGRDAGKAFARLGPGEWTPNIVQVFETSEGRKEAVFRCKLLELSPDGSSLRLYVSPLCALDGWSYPEEVAGEIRSEGGLPMPHGGFQALNLEWVDAGTFLEIVDLAHVWLADAAVYLLGHKDWDLFFMHAHCPDHAYHAFATKMDPLTAGSEEEARFYQEVELGFYRSLDRMIGRILEAGGEDVLVILVSDHGAKATTYTFRVADVLEAAGLLAYREAEDGERVVDWSRTKAVQQRSCYIYVNLKGRDPQGIVEPEEYEEVREAVIKALYDYTDTETGKKPIALALKREDARIIGLYGDRVGDVVYAITSDFGGQHGPHLPAARFGLGDLRGLFVMAGPGVKKGVVLERTVRLEDIVPTICYLAELPVPRDAEGGVLYQALEDPDVKLKELQRLRRNYRRLQGAFEKERALGHTYNE